MNWVLSSQHFYNISSLKEAHRRTRNLWLCRNFNENGKSPRLGVFPYILISLHLKGGLISNIELIKGTSRSSYQAKSNANSSLYWLLEEIICSLAETPNTLATWCEELTHLERPWCWERLRAGGEGDDRGWDGWMTSPTQGVGDGQGGLSCCGSWGRKESDWATELNWTEWKLAVYLRSIFIKLNSLETLKLLGKDERRSYVMIEKH